MSFSESAESRGEARRKLTQFHPSLRGKRGERREEERREIEPSFSAFVKERGGGEGGALTSQYISLACPLERGKKRGGVVCAPAGGRLGRKRKRAWLEIIFLKGGKKGKEGKEGGECIVDAFFYHTPIGSIMGERDSRMVDLGQ